MRAILVVIGAAWLTGCFSPGGPGQPGPDAGSPDAGSPDAGSAETDLDDDGVADAIDNCPDRGNRFQGDEDGDGVGDACDLCPLQEDATQANADGDGLGDACDSSALGIDSIDAFLGFGPADAALAAGLPVGWVISEGLLQIGTAGIGRLYGGPWTGGTQATHHAVTQFESDCTMGVWSVGLIAGGESVPNAPASCTIAAISSGLVLRAGGGITPEMMLPVGSSSWGIVMVAEPARMLCVAFSDSGQYAIEAPMVWPAQTELSLSVDGTSVRLPYLWVTRRR